MSGCKHDYKYLQQEIYRRDGDIIGSIIWETYHVFYCGKCLQYRNVLVKTEYREKHDYPVVVTYEKGHE